MTRASLGITFPNATTEIVLRLADPTDAATIEKIASAVNVHKYSHIGKGFLVYTLSAMEYRKRILEGQHIYMFDFGGQSVGFICGYDQRGLAYYLKETTLSHESSVCHAIQGLAAERGDAQYLFLDQIAILPALQDQGFGEKFFLHFCQTVSGPFYVAMLEAPTRNPRIAYWQARGFLRIGQALERLPQRFAPKDMHPVISDKLIWGIYVLPLMKFMPIRTNQDDLASDW
jgi:hypothetical protein